MATRYALIALTTEGQLFEWKWSEAKGESQPMALMKQLELGPGICFLLMKIEVMLDSEERIVDISASANRIAVFTNENRVATWLDGNATGERLFNASFLITLKTCYWMIFIGSLRPSKISSGTERAEGRAGSK